MFVLLTAEDVNDRHAYREKWPGASESDQCEDQKVYRVAIRRFRTMKFSAQSPESVQPVRATLFFGAGARRIER